MDSSSIFSLLKGYRDHNYAHTEMRTPLLALHSVQTVYPLSDLCDLLMETFNRNMLLVELMLSEVANPGPHLSQCVRTYVVSHFRNVISHAQLTGLTFRNVIYHGNFHKYDSMARGINAYAHSLWF